VSGADHRFRDLVPRELVLPCEYTDGVVSLEVMVAADPVRVYVPGLDDVKGVLAVGSAELVRSYCSMWTRFLTLAAAGIRGDGS
jgi:hypothetical protein